MLKSYFTAVATISHEDRVVQFLFFFFFAPIWKQCRGTWGERIDASLIGGTDFFFGGGEWTNSTVKTAVRETSRVEQSRKYHTVEMQV